MRYNFSKIENKWQRFWREKRIYEPLDLTRGKPLDFVYGERSRTARGKNAKRFYNLMMFPYPSAEGLHVGNMCAFTGADIYGRMKRMQGYDVFQPIGLDGFGIHSENYALKIKAHPMKQAKVSEKRFYEQLQMIGNGFAWDEKLETYDPEYYKWTQWIFVQMFKRGLAYRAKAPVNWCPSCKTVLADEQVITGRCERCGALVERKELEQWFFRITKYAEKLLQNLEKIDWSERVKIAQRNWIGKSEGALIKFPILWKSDFHRKSDFPNIEVFTTRPDTLFGAAFMVISPELAQKWMDSGWAAPEEVKKYVAKALKNRNEEQKDKTGVFSGIYAVNPANKKEIPVWVSDYVLAGYGTGAIMAVPAHDERDRQFAEKFKLSISDAPLVDKEEIIKKVGGKRETHHRLRDWLVSRQRYWGPPIPVIYCDKCPEILNPKSEILNKSKTQNFQTAVIDGKKYAIHAVPEKDLPVELPFVKDFQPKGKGESPLASDKSFYETNCPKCGGKARRETDVSDTFLDSAWYYLRYPSVNLSKAGTIPWDSAVTKRWLPVDMYIGGAEHSVLHLLYVRFLALALHDEGLLEFGKSEAPKGEPFPKFRAHGLLISEGAKMSKSKGNVVIPDEYIKKFGADTLRMYLMFLAPFEYGGDFRDAGILGISRFLERVWKIYVNIGRSDLPNISAKGGSQPETDAPREHASGGDVNVRRSDLQKLERLTHRTIKKVTEDIENLHYNTAISALMILFNEFDKTQLPITNYQLQVFLKLLAPFAPHITEELWHQLQEVRPPKIDGRNVRRSNLQKLNSIHKERWPEYNLKLIKEETFELVIQINGKHRATLSLPAGVSESEAKKAAMGDEKIKNLLAGAKVKKIIFVKDRLINFVV